MSKPLILFNSITYAMMAQKALGRYGIYGDVIKTPKFIASCGCGYCLRIYIGCLSDALSVLEKENIPFVNSTEGEEKP